MMKLKGFRDLKKERRSYLDSSQSDIDGLWHDQSLKNKNYDDSDCRGARNLAIHIISAYAAVGAKLKFNISYLEKFFKL